MRPVRLDLEGFATFRQRAELDFDGLDLVAFTGPTGAGKSSLIDAITFALYGSVARYADARKVAPVIHQLATDARVRLVFESAGTRYIATRVVRRMAAKSGAKPSSVASTREARLERVEADGGTTVLAGTVKELDRAVPELLGLDFDQFTRTIVLPQGEFASFLRDDQANRDKLLQRLLDLGIYERIGQEARSRAKTAADQIAVHRDRLERLTVPTKAEMTALSRRLESLLELRATAETGVAELATLDRSLDPLRQRVNELDDAIGRLAAIDLSLDIDGLEVQLNDFTEAKEAADQKLATARQERDGTRAELAGLPEKADLARMRSVIDQLAETREEKQEQEQELVDLAAESERLAAETERLETDTNRANDDLRRAGQAADAAAWTEALEVGEACPVCRQEVRDIPDHDATGELQVVEQRLADLVAAGRSAAKKTAMVAERQRVIAKEVERSEDRIELLGLQHSTWNGPPDRDGIDAALASVGRLETDLQGLEQVVVEAERAVVEATEGLTRLQTQLAASQAAVSRARDGVADLSPPELSHRSPVEDARTLIEWRDRHQEALASQRNELAAEGKQLAERRRQLVDRVTGLASTVGIETAVTGLEAAVAEASARAEADLAEADRLRTEHAAESDRISNLESGRLLDEELGRHLRAGGFTSWLLAEALDAIVAKASVWLQQLSNGQYSLIAGHKAFVIVDHNNALEQRDVRTLSGGETFLASLALALALADSVAELAPVDAPGLDSMFLDEGFGTLDPATLDVVATAIEELASSGRMIGIVTHVADLAERLPARFRVSKTASTSTVELVMA